jgi:hypothetical protein
MGLIVVDHLQLFFFLRIFLLKELLLQLLDVLLDLLQHTSDFDLFVGQIVNEYSVLFIRYFIILTTLTSLLVLLLFE